MGRIALTRTPSSRMRRRHRLEDAEYAASGQASQSNVLSESNARIVVEIPPDLAAECILGATIEIFLIAELRLAVGTRRPRPGTLDALRNRLPTGDECLRPNRRAAVVLAGVLWLVPLACAEPYIN